MSQMKDGGQAFPRVVEQPNGYMQAVEGMALRDYFAAKAMQGWLSSYPTDMDAEHAAKGLNIVARFAYDMADAMLKAREASHE